MLHNAHKNLPIKQSVDDRKKTYKKEYNDEGRVIKYRVPTGLL